jgi:hypothetical protein
MKLFSKEFAVYAGERAVKTLFQTFLALVGGQQLQVFDADWVSLIGLSLGAGLLSVATSVVTKAKLTSEV